MSSTSPPTESSEVEYDLVFLHSRKEAIIIFCAWLVTFVWAVPFCYFTGHLDFLGKFDAESFKTVWGIPFWIFWGIFIPWIAADIFTTWFCFCYMIDDDIGEAHEGADIEEEIAEMHASDAAKKGAE